jgi:hypothetical protein
MNLIPGDPDSRRKMPVAMQSSSQRFGPGALRVMNNRSNKHAGRSTIIEPAEERIGEK